MSAACGWRASEVPALQAVFAEDIADPRDDPSAALEKTRGVRDDAFKSREFFDGVIPNALASHSAPPIFGVVGSSAARELAWIGSAVHAALTARMKRVASLS